MIEETNLEEELATDASMCVVFSNQPGGDVFANEAMLKSPFTDQFTTHLYNPGGGAHHAGGNYPMMLADIKSSVMKVCHSLYTLVCHSLYTLFCLVLLCASMGLAAADTSYPPRECVTHSTLSQQTRHASWQQYARDCYTTLHDTTGH